MQSMHIEYATEIYANRLQEAAHYRLVKRAKASRQRKTARASIRTLGQFIPVLVKQR
jgi:hypothetical protein